MKPTLTLISMLLVWVCFGQVVQQKNGHHYYMNKTDTVYVKWMDGLENSEIEKSIPSGVTFAQKKDTSAVTFPTLPDSLMSKYGGSYQYYTQQVKQDTVPCWFKEVIVHKAGYSCDMCPYVGDYVSEQWVKGFCLTNTYQTPYFYEDKKKVTNYILFSIPR